MTNEAWKLKRIGEYKKQVNCGACGLLQEKRFNSHCAKCGTVFR